MTCALSISVNPLINRFATPTDLVAVCSDEIGIDRIQLTNEFINPAWPRSTVSRLVREFDKAASEKGLKATSLMTGISARINNLGHPDPDVRDWTVDWMIKMAQIAADLGAPSVGSQFAILTYADYDDPARREIALEAALDCWKRIWEGAEKAGLDYLYWEQMSVGREIGHTIDSTRKLCQRIDESGIPLKILLDVDHGDVSSDDPRDTDPYAWIAEFGADCPIIHVKQSTSDKGGHWPFIEPYNSKGKITPEKLLATIASVRPQGAEICLELGFREREPSDRLAVQHLRESVSYWKTGIALAFVN
jgi:sugar phosphate isomerase/epimerase